MADLDRSRTRGAALFATLFLATSLALYPARARAVEGVPDQAPGAPLRILAKLAPSLSREVESALSIEAAGLQPSQVGSQRLAGFFQGHGIRRLTPLYPDLVRRKKQSGRTDAELAEDIRREFPVRARRAPLGARMPELSRTYVLEPAKVSADTLEEMLKRLKADPDVEWAERDQVARVQLIPNDPYFSSHGSWGRPYGDLYGAQLTSAPSGWDLAQGDGVVVAVVDTGLDYTHPDIDANVWTNPGEIPNNHVDDDGNGYVDDVRGWDFVTCEEYDLPGCVRPRPPDNDPMDDHGHGTHVSGTIAAEGNNGLGIIGIAFRSKIMPLKGLAASGIGTLSDLVSAIQYAADNGADVMNNSWGAAFFSQALVDAVLYAHGLGVVVTAAAGNSAADVADFLPAGIPEVVAVAAANAYDRVAWFSNIGRGVDVTAPGVEILSLRAQGTDMYGDGTHVVGGVYYRANGTSMACPHVSGAAALLISRFPDLGNEELRDRLVQTADPLDVLNPAYAGLMGGGRINLIRSLTETPGPGPLFSISGTVRDEHGPLAGGRVHLFGGSVGFLEAVTGSDGAYQFSGLREGPYKAVVLAAGDRFKPPSRTYQPLLATQTGQDFTGEKRWDIQEPDPDVASSVGEGVSIAIDAQGRPHISYNNERGLNYARWNGAGWDRQVVDDTEGSYTGIHSSLALDSQGRPHIAYDAGDLFSFARYAHWNGAAWEIEIVPGLEQTLYFPDMSLALDAANRPRVLYGSRNTPLQYAERNGMAWTVQTIDSSKQFFLGDNSLVLDSGGRPHIAYYAISYFADRPGHLKYATRPGTGWQVTDVDEVAEHSGAHLHRTCAIKLDSSGRAHIVYASAEEDSLKYAVRSGQGWSRETVESSYGNLQRLEYLDGGLVLGRDGAPHIFYFAWPQGLKYATRGALGWTSSSIHPLAAGRFNDLAMDAEGFLHAVYYDGTLDLEKKLKYARSLFKTTAVLQVLAPRAGDTWIAGSTQTISWQTQNPPPGAWVGSIRLWMDTLPVADIRLQASPVTGALQWQVPNNLPPYPYYLVQAVLYQGPPDNPTEITDGWGGPFRVVTAR